MLSILKWSPRSRGPTSWTHHSPLVWCLIPSKWHHHPSCCAHSEPRSHPGHSLFHSVPITHLPTKSPLFFKDGWPLTASTSSVPSHHLPLAGSLQLRCIWSTHVLSGLPLISSLSSRLSECLKLILPKPPSPTPTYLFQKHSMKTRQGKFFHWKEAIPFCDWPQRVV